MFKKLCPCESTHTLGRERTERRETKGVGQGEVTRAPARGVCGVSRLKNGMKEDKQISTI